MEGEAFLMRGSFVDAEICQYRALHDAERDGQLCMVLAAHFCGCAQRCFRENSAG